MREEREEERKVIGREGEERDEGTEMERTKKIEGDKDGGEREKKRKKDSDRIRSTRNI